MDIIKGETKMQIENGLFNLE